MVVHRLVSRAGGRPRGPAEAEFLTAGLDAVTWLDCEAGMLFLITAVCLCKTTELQDAASSGCYSACRSSAVFHWATGVLMQWQVSDLCSMMRSADADRDL